MIQLTPSKQAIFASVTLVAYLPASLGVGSLSRRAVTVSVALMWGGGVIAAYFAGGRDLTLTLECAALMPGCERPVRRVL